MTRHPVSELEAVIPLLIDALSREGGAFAFLHGSAGAGRDFADLDIGIWLDDAAGDPLRVASDIADRLEAAVARPVDVQLLNEAPATFGFHVSHGRLLTVRDEAALAAWRERTWREYFDMQPYIEEQARLLLGTTRTLSK